MSKIKLCGLSRPCDIDAANELRPEYIGFVFAKKSIRCVTPKEAADLKALLSPDIQAVGVFVNEQPEVVADLLNSSVIDMAQLHGSESEEYISRLRTLTEKPVIKAFKVDPDFCIEACEKSTADFILFDSGAGTGTTFDWGIIQDVKRPYFLAGGISPENVAEAIKLLNPYVVDVSTGIETDGKKDKAKMAAFVEAVRKENGV